MAEVLLLSKSLITADTLTLACKQAFSIVFPPPQQKSKLYFLNMRAVLLSAVTISAIVLFFKFSIIDCLPDKVTHLYSKRQKSPLLFYPKTINVICK